MARTQTKVNKGTLFTTLFFLSLILFFLPQNITKNLNFFFIELFKPLLSIGGEKKTYIFRPSNPEEQYISRAEYNSLWTAYKNIEADLQTLADEYQTLANYRTIVPEAGTALVPASVITFEPSKYLIINRGLEHGIEKGQFVMGLESIIGIVSEVSPATARIDLITNKNHITPVRIWRTGSKKYISGNMAGTGLGRCSIGLISRENDIRVGDAVYAAPKPGVLNSPRIIGEVSHLWPDTDNPLLWDIKVTPLYSAEEFEDVAVIIMNPKVED